jgi:hypothetical protein
VPDCSGVASHLKASTCGFDAKNPAAIAGLQSGLIRPTWAESFGVFSACAGLGPVRIEEPRSALRGARRAALGKRLRRRFRCPRLAAGQRFRSRPRDARFRRDVNSSLSRVRVESRPVRKTREHTSRRVLGLERSERSASLGSASPHMRVVYFQVSRFVAVATERAPRKEPVWSCRPPSFTSSS